MLDWIASALSGEQKEPFDRSAANACILAAAGSGKTRTLVHLVAADLAAGIPGSGMVAFTFTEKAGEELLARIHSLIKQNLPEIRLEGMYIGTIHAWCLRYLTEQTEFYNFAPLDELHVDALVSRLYDSLALEEAYGLRYPRAIGRFLADLEIFYNEFLSLEDIPSFIRPCIASFLDTLHTNRLVTYGGMVRYATELLEKNGPVTGLQALYIDEYQDVNPAQVALIKPMLPADGKVVVVGDDLQCIYNWRGSDVSRILNFHNEFGDASVHRLHTNYRSRPAVVDLGNKVAENVTFRDHEKSMTHHRGQAPCRIVHLLSLDCEEEQAETVADLVEKFAAEGVPWNRIAVLLRSVVGSGRPIVDALTSRDVPVYCPILSRGGEFINELLVPLFSWLSARHDEPRSPIEEADAGEAANALWDGVRQWVPAVNGEGIFWQAVNHWCEAIEQERNEGYDVRGRLYDLLDTCGIRMAPNDHNLMVGLGIASQIIRSVEEIHRRRLEGSQRRTPRGVMSEVYFALRRNQHDFGETLPIDTSADGVLLTTVHQAKGLEWPVVIIPGLVDGRFPVRSRGHATSFPDDIAGRYGTSVDDERRLFYVATMRARERLFLLDPVRQQDHKRSIFLQELPENELSPLGGLTQIEPSVWGIAHEDLRDPDPPPLRIGLADLLIYVDCPYQFGLRRVVAVQPSVGDELGFGKGLHEVIQRRFDAGRVWTAQELVEEVRNHVNLPYMSREGEVQSQQAIQSRVRRLEQLGVFGGEVEPEVAVDVLLDGGIVHGVVDGIQANDDGSLLIRDWKSNIHDAFVPRYERQLQFYAYALCAQDRVVSSAQIVDVAASAKTGTLVAREVDIAESTRRGLIEILEQSLEGIAGASFDATPSQVSCSCCDMYRICSERCPDDAS